MRVSSHITSLAVAFVLLGTGAVADTLPDGPGKAAAVRVCGRCHSAELLATKRQRRSEWQDTIVKMIKLGATGSDLELEAVFNYVSTYLGPETPGPVNINTARPVELEAGLLLLRSQAEALVAYRAANGPFHSFDDVAKVPGLDVNKLEQQKSRITF